MARSFSRGIDSTKLVPLLVHIGALMPAAVLTADIGLQQLGVDPVGQAVRLSGRYALIMLLVALLPGPLGRILGLAQVMRMRKSLGLYAFGYAALHFLLYAGWDYRFQLEYLSQTIVRSPFIWAGLAALLILLALAVTSSKGWMRRLGRGWRRLHRLVLLAAAFAALHYAWVFKELRVWPVVAGIVVLILAVVRLPAVERVMRRWARSKPSSD